MNPYDLATTAAIILTIYAAMVVVTVLRSHAPSLAEKFVDQKRTLVAHTIVALMFFAVAALGAFVVAAVKSP